MVLSRLQTGLARWRSDPPPHARFGARFDAPPPPPKALAASEVPRVAWMLATRWRHAAALAAVPPGAGGTVMILPGLFDADGSSLVLRRFLEGLGYRAEGWGLGRNLGVKSVGAEAERLIARVEALEAEDGPVTLVGVSLGGIMARLVAHRRPDLVRRVVTVSSPYAGWGRATNVWRAFEWATGERVDDPAVIARSEAIAAPLPVPCTAIWSPHDGFVNGFICHDPSADAVQVNSGHLGVHIHPEVLIAVAAALAKDAVAQDR
ncbi:alpha/beta hydrolase [Arthrobacter sp. TPD3018]|uniref:alpha/beta fold hydrolase n=1 Tax=Bacteria TaxID=2 RepID=UPI000D506089|nr:MULTISPECIES: alpha/beta fold hydrolase [Bacteria]PVE57946.1 alpha/beta hydrolase [Sphingomonas sp. TPD3009]PVE58448.1 alpha/beta hydrolase [Arthrobacter sp. TPD3018]PVE87795.1 alpha/beta hydrolase [Sphingomonas melonis]